MIQINSLNKSFILGNQSFPILRNIDLTIHKGEFVCIMGASGSGKTTLLQLLGGLDTPTSGEITVKNVTISKQKEKQLSLFRRKHIGFIFQQFNLVPVFNAEENITLPLMLDNVASQKASQKANELLKLVGLEGKEKHLPAQLSGGQQQRVAIARAFANEPALLLADEPTGALDSENTNTIIRTLRNACDELGQTAVVVTHDSFVAAHADRIIFLFDGEVVQDYVAMEQWQFRNMNDEVARIQHIMNQCTNKGGMKHAMDI
ncbi:putative ABC transport system ATP-binding protein [Priestia taiwanensis]|uniref:ABC transporter ATP-binding protein n=2 Tax=Priestia taiwanensis TaxID=1347902 RepID=A0A917AL94_9BACI|nr:putative ABC transport system ATP-binding protein [Priestia taiwanensis]GGE60223.1 ABC transporter ATP-binding protein [Priestia taiwanensis]